MYLHHLRHLKPATVGPAHNISECQVAVGDSETVTEKISKRRLEWLGHLARIPDERTSKISLFSWLPEPRPRGGPRKRWRDVIHADLKEMKNAWYEKATTSRAIEWCATCRQARKDITYREQHQE